MSAYRERLARVHERIAAACAKARRPEGSVALVAVSKRHPASAVREVYALGQRAFGENYVQELQTKAAELAELSELRWHLIGNLQRNKAKYVAPLRAVVETVDTPRLADALADRVVGAPLPVLAQVSLAGEAQKSGCTEPELPALLDAIRARAELDLRGLMTVPPLENEAETNRRYFARLAELASQHALRELSMGMSADLEVAVEEGATIVRVGTAIFGERP
ncbi:MAG: YggS family pyridoxal phosphate-dependent enzyme [Sandaracinaceae bacterium]